MKPVTIDAIRQRKVELEASIAGVVAKAQVLHDKAEAEKRDLTIVEAGEFTQHLEALVPLKAKLAREDFFLAEIMGQLERERNLGAVIDATTGLSTQGKDSRKLWVKGFAQQLQAVARAERTGQIDPRLTGVF